jgi:hypothetical protein
VFGRYLEVLELNCKHLVFGRYLETLAIEMGIEARAYVIGVRFVIRFDVPKHPVTEAPLSS